MRKQKRGETKAGKPTQAGLKNKADKLCREYFQLTHEGCVACGWRDYKGRVMRCSERIEWAHLISRREGLLRHHPLNYTALCNTHHRFFTEHPKEWTEFIDKLYPDRWDRLYRMLIEGGKPDYEYWLEFYGPRVKELKALHSLDPHSRYQI